MFEDHSFSVERKSQGGERLTEDCNELLHLSKETRTLYVHNSIVALFVLYLHELGKLSQWHKCHILASLLFYQKGNARQMEESLNCILFWRKGFAEGWRQGE